MDDEHEAQPEQTAGGADEAQRAFFAMTPYENN